MNEVDKRQALLVAMSALIRSRAQYAVGDIESAAWADALAEELVDLLVDAGAEAWL